MIYGSHDAGWLSFYDYMREVLGLRNQTEKLIGLIELSKCCGWWSPYQNVAVLQHRHCELHRDERGRLHNEKGMAVKYRDGWGVCAWHGVRMPAWVIETPEKITPQSIKDESNQEIRSAMMAMYGWDKYIRAVDARLVHSDGYGDLYEWIDGGDKIQVVAVVNGTPEPDGKYKDYYLRVRPIFKTALEAVASTYPGIRVEDYVQMVRT